MDTPRFMYVKFHGLVSGCVAEFEVVHPGLMQVNIYDKNGIEMRCVECGDAKLFRKDL